MAARGVTRPAWCEGVVEPVVRKAEALKAGDIFYDEDDVDRMKEKHGLFALPERGGDEAEEVVKIDLREADGPERFGAIVKNALTSEECDEILKYCNVKQFGPSLINIGRGRQAYYPDTRGGYRCIVDDPTFAATLLKRLEKHLPTMWEGRCLRDINERLRVLCYEKPTDTFEPHFDGCYCRPLGHPHEGDKSKITIQIYLNTIPRGQGGETTLFTSKGDIPVYPEKGAVLLFSQNVYHEGSPLKSEGIKYTLRTEAMYQYV